MQNHWLAGLCSWLVGCDGLDGRGDSVLLNYMDGPREGGGGTNGEVDFVLQYKFDGKLWHHI